MHDGWVSCKVIAPEDQVKQHLSEQCAVLRRHRAESCGIRCSDMWEVPLVYALDILHCQTVLLTRDMGFYHGSQLELKGNAFNIDFSSG